MYFNTISERLKISPGEIANAVGGQSALICLRVFKGFKLTRWSEKTGFYQIRSVVLLRPGLMNADETIEILDQTVEIDRDSLQVFQVLLAVPDLLDLEVKQACLPRDSPANVCVP